MELTKLLRAILPDVLIDNFDVVNFDKSELRFDIYLDEKKVQMREDKKYGYRMVLATITSSRTILSVVVPPISMCASASGWTRTPARYSATTGICPSLTKLV